jgi:hypothetical protein
MAPSLIHAALSLLSEQIRALGLRFDRVRCWTPERVVAGLIMIVSHPGLTSIEKMMPALVAAFGLPASPVDSTFVEARQKFSKRFPDAMRVLWQRLMAFALERIPAERRLLGGLQWVAVDGTWAWAPHAAGVIARWGRPKAGEGRRLHYAQMLMVTALDVLTRLPLAASLLPHDGSERAGLRQFLGVFKKGVVLMVDRGFPAKWLLGEMTLRGADILWRMGTAEANSWDCVHRFLHDRNKPTDGEATLRLDDGRVIRVRLIRRVFKRGRPRKGQTRETMVLMTTLLDTVAWPSERLIAMYERRWDIETWFRDIKVHFGMESFHSRSEKLIEQEILSLMTWMTLCSIIERDAYARVERSRGRQRADDPHRFQISPSNLYCAAARIFHRLLLTGNVELALQQSEVDLKWLDQTARRRRPFRSHQRTRKAAWGRWNG